MRDPEIEKEEKMRLACMKAIQRALNLLKRNASDASINKALIEIEETARIYKAYLKASSDAS